MLHRLDAEGRVGELLAWPAAFVHQGEVSFETCGNIQSRSCAVLPSHTRRWTQPDQAVHF